MIKTRQGRRKVNTDNGGVVEKGSKEWFRRVIKPLVLKQQRLGTRCS